MKANLSGANLQHARNLTQRQFYGTFGKRLHGAAAININRGFAGEFIVRQGKRYRTTLALNSVSSWLQRADRKAISRLGLLESTCFRVGSKVGEVYQTPEQAEADVKRLCKESKAEDWPPCDPGNAE